MSRALPGMHYCRAHQGNHSHYAEHNCAVCAMAAALRATVVAIMETPCSKMDTDAWRAVADQATAALAKAAL